VLEAGSATPDHGSDSLSGGRRRADVPVDWVAPVEAPETSYVGRRRASVPVDSPIHASASENHPKVDVAPEPARELATELDTSTIDRVLSSLEPVDHSTSFEHEPTTALPLLRAEPPAPGGKRRALKHAGGRGPFVKGFVSAPVLVGIAALAVSVGGVVTVNDASPASSTTATDSHVAASALGGASGTGHFSARNPTVSRGGGRDGQAGSTLSAASGQEKLQAAAQGAADERSQALQGLTAKADSHDKYLAKNLWIYPLEPVILTARFGQYGLWSSYHTGLDFNGNTGDPIHAIADGVVISAGYDGSYGNKTVVRLDDGTELWYCHQSAFEVSVGDEVHQGEIIGLVGATGHVTGSHLHVEVHPGGGDPVDPYPAMQQHGLFLGSEAQPG
jgi:murein DD-endopeptidase MepM/ murein hydrolase activator NlpD